MRVLFTYMAYTGHFHPLVPLAREVARAGHEVAFATHPTLLPQVSRAGFRHFPAGLFRDSPEVGELWAEAEGLSGEAFYAFATGRDFVALRAARMARDLLPLIERWPADLIVRDELEFGACVAAERLGRRTPPCRSRRLGCRRRPPTGSPRPSTTCAPPTAWRPIRSCRCRSAT